MSILVLYNKNREILPMLNISFQQIPKCPGN